MNNPVKFRELLDDQKRAAMMLRSQWRTIKNALRDADIMIHSGKLLPDPFLQEIQVKMNEIGLLLKGAISE